MRWFVFFIACLCLPTVANAAWHRAESENFILFAELGANEIRERMIELESLDRVMRIMTNIDAEAAEVKLQIFMVTNANAVRDYLGGGEAAGYYEPSMRGPYAVVPRRNVRVRLTRGGPYLVIPDRNMEDDTLDMTTNHILFHEYAHHFMFQYAPSSYPSWYIEGFAELFATAEVRDDGWVILGRPMAGRIFNFSMGRRIPYADLLSNTLPNTYMTYSQGWILAHYAMFNDEAGELLGRYLAALAQGASGVTAYTETFGRLEESLDLTLRDYGLGSRVPGVGKWVGAIDPTMIAITELSESEAEIAMLFPRNADQLISRVRRAAERYPNEPQVYVELARYHQADGELANAMQAIDQALVLNPDHVEANNLKGDILLADARDIDDVDHPNWGLARTHYLRANRADPRSAQALHGYYDSFPDPATRPENAIAALESAFVLIPQNEHLRMDLARVYLSRRQYRDALDAIMPIIQAPHADANEELMQLAEQARQGLDIDAAPVPVNQPISTEEEPDSN